MTERTTTVPTVLLVRAVRIIDGVLDGTSPLAQLATLREDLAAAVASDPLPVFGPPSEVAS